MRCNNFLFMSYLLVFGISESSMLSWISGSPCLLWPIVLSLSRQLGRQQHIRSGLFFILEISHFVCFLSFLIGAEVSGQPNLFLFMTLQSSYPFISSIYDIGIFLSYSYLFSIYYIATFLSYFQSDMKRATFATLIP